MGGGEGEETMGVQQIDSLLDGLKCDLRIKPVDNTEEVHRNDFLEVFRITPSTFCSCSGVQCQ